MKTKKLKSINIKKIKHKIISLFTVVTAEDFKAITESKLLTVPHKFLTLTQTPEEALEYVDALEYNDHFDHYKNWCINKKLNYELDESWLFYKNTVLGKYSDYAIFELKLEWEDIIAFIRMFQGCIPLGCSFDREVEILNLTKNIKQNKNNLNLKDNSSETKTTEINKEDIVN